MKCKHCNGKGVTEKETELINTKSQLTEIWTKLCLKCFGTGELDWVENIVGKKNPEDIQIRIMGHPSTRIEVYN